MRRALLLAVLASLTVASTAAAQDAPAGDAPTDLGAYAEAIAFTSTDAVIAVEGTGRFRDTVEFRADGTIVNDTTLEHYVEGIAEVPLRWPEDALAAQAVAARTYAWWVIENSRYDGYDICGTVACQVFRGQEVVEGPLGDRWRAAVAATAGEVLTTDGEPILARFFSSSGGRTRANEEVFPEQGVVPYLRAVDDPYDEVSPWHRWRVPFTRADLDAVLARLPQFAAAVPVARYEFVDDAPDQVRFTGRDGTVVTAPASEFRFGVSDVAPQLFPDRYPTRAGLRSLPQTIPSSRFRFVVEGDTVTVDGGGFGHGVGMSQYGALGRAQAGHDYPEILAAYYSGIRPARAEGLPDRVRVAVVEERSSAVVVPDAPVTVTAGGEVITDRALGRWEVRRRDDGTLNLLAPPGYGAPLVVGPTVIDDPTPTEGQTIALTTVVNKPAVLAVVVTDPDGGEVLRVPAGTATASGSLTVPFALDDVPLSPGRYRVAVAATDEEGEEAAVPTDLEVLAAEDPAAAATAQPGPGDGAPTRSIAIPIVLGLIAAAGVALGAIGLVRARRR